MSSTRSDTELIDLIDNVMDGQLTVTFQRLYQPEYQWQVGIKLQFESTRKGGENYELRSGAMTIREALHRAFDELDRRKVNAVGARLKG